MLKPDDPGREDKVTAQSRHSRDGQLRAVWLGPAAGISTEEVRDEAEDRVSLQGASWAPDSNLKVLGCPSAAEAWALVGVGLCPLGKS